MKRLVPEVVSGYDLDEQRGMFSIVLNEGTENISTNPSGETSTTGFTATAGSSVARTVNYQTSGLFGIAVTTNATVNAGVYQSYSLQAGDYYTFSADVRGRSGTTYVIIIASGATTLVRKEFKSLRKWKRPYATFQVPSNGTYNFCIVQRDPSAHTFYTDSWQIENKKYPTTYCDGDMKGYVVGEMAYRWTGVKHASSSIRLASTRSGGREYFLYDYNFQLLGITGFGSPPVNNFTKDITSGGEYYIGSNYGARLFTINGAFFGSSKQDLENNKVAVQNLVDFERNIYAQEILIRYRPEGDRLDKPYNIKCHYVSGLEGNFVSEYQERVSIQFKQSEPGIVFDGDSCAELNQTTVWSPLSRDGSFINPGGFIIKNSTERVNIFYGTDGVTGDAYSLKCAIMDRNGGIYLGGSFTDVYGIADTTGIAYFNGSTFVSIGDITGTVVNSMVLLPNGKVLVGGSFTVIGGVTTNNLAVYDPATSTWAAFGSPNGEVYSVFYLDGYVYVAGAYTNISSTAISYISRSVYTAASFSAMGTAGGAVNVVHGVKVGSGTTKIYIGVDSTFKIRMTSDMSTWTDVHTRTLEGSESDLWFNSMTSIGSTVYFVQDVETINVILTTIYKIVDVTATAIITRQHSINEDSVTRMVGLRDTGLLISGGVFETTGSPSISLISPSAFSTFRRNSAFYPGVAWGIYGYDNVGWLGDYIVGESPVNNGEIFVIGIASIKYIYKIVTVNGSSAAYPTFHFYGPGTLYSVANTTTRETIYFTQIDIVDGEELTIKMNENETSVQSNFQGDLSSKIMGGSYAAIHLIPGENLITASFVTNDLSPSETGIMWGTAFSNTDNGTLYYESTNETIYENSGKTLAVAEKVAGTSRWEEANSSGVNGEALTNPTDYTLEVGMSFISWRETFYSLDGIE